MKGDIKSLDLCYLVSMGNLFLILIIVLFCLVGLAIYSVLKKRVKTDYNSEYKEKTEHHTGSQTVHVNSVDTNERKTEVFTPEHVENTAVFLEAKAKAMEIILEAKDGALKIKTETQDFVRDKKNDIAKQEAQLVARESLLSSKEQELNKQSDSINSLKDSLNAKIQNYESLVNEEQAKLEKVAKLSVEEARKRLLDTLDKELKDEYGKKIKSFEDELKLNSESKAREILIEAMRQGATDYVVEYTTSRVRLPDEELKGRIIGKEGRNIKHFEEISGVDVDLDSSPGDLLISCFDPVRREIARLTLEKLIADGRIQPAKIEELYEKSKNELNQIILKEGTELCHRVSLFNIPKEILSVLGKFKYRFSYGQNMIEHVTEVVQMGASIANQLGADVEIVKLGCLFHDIGKVIMDQEGSHVDIGVEFLKKHKINEKVINCVAEHHEDRPFSSLESAIVALADHISGARPGSRKEDFESYTKRMRNLEEAAKGFDGVDKAFAISAGREVRVYVKPFMVDDHSAAFLAREIAKKIELEQTYPGTIKVLVIRETRETAVAK